jgi:predicted nucleotidyltransferase
MSSLDARRQIAIAEFVHRVRAALGPHVIDLRLFGSVARRDAEPDSDIDILVIVQPDHERAQLERQAVDIAFDVNLQYDLYISPRVLPSSMLAHPVWGQTPFLKTIQRESVAL